MLIIKFVIILRARYAFVAILLLILLICETPMRRLSVYEVYVKEESGPDSRSGDTSDVSGLGSLADQQLIQVINRCESFINENDLRSCKITFKDDCMDLDAAIDSEVINIDGSVTKLLGKDALRYKVSAKVRYLKYLSNY